jgi:hypothetical protein
LTRRNENLEAPPREQKPAPVRVWAFQIRLAWANTDPTELPPMLDKGTRRRTTGTGQTCVIAPTKPRGRFGSNSAVADAAAWLPLFMVEIGPPLASVDDACTSDGRALWFVSVPRQRPQGRVSRGGQARRGESTPCTRGGSRAGPEHGRSDGGDEDGQVARADRRCGTAVTTAAEWATLRCGHASVEARARSHLNSCQSNDLIQSSEAAMAIPAG